MYKCALFSFIAVNLVVLLFLLNQKLFPGSQTRDIREFLDDLSTKQVKLAKRCIHAKLGHAIRTSAVNMPQTWNLIPEIPEKCSMTIYDRLPLFFGPEEDANRKYFIAPLIDTACSIISFGISNDTASEKHIKDAFPHCQFLAFDSDHENNEAQFKQDLQGKFVAAHVTGEKHGRLDAIFTRNGFHYDADVRYSSAATLLKLFHDKQRLVDLLNVNVDGDEFEVMDSVLQHHMFHQVCQLNVKLHASKVHSSRQLFPFSAEPQRDVLKTFRRFLAQSGFLWLKAEIGQNDSLAAFAANVQNKHCRKLYLNGHWMV